MAITIRKPPVVTRIEYNTAAEFSDDRDLAEKYGFYSKYASWRWLVARDLERYCRTGDKDFLELARKAATELLRDPRSERILLYLPFSLMDGATSEFKEAYLKAWRRLLGVQDVRENFYEGDVFELDARPEGGLERVVKAAHLTPWLIVYNFIDEEEWTRILEKNQRDGILLQSFAEAFTALMLKGILNPAYMSKIAMYLEKAPKRKKVEPTYVSEKRKKWLEEHDKPFEELLTPDVWLGDPFNDQGLFGFLQPKLKEIGEKLPPREIALVGGSQVKGYGTVGSDLDVWYYSELQKEKWSEYGSPEAAHIYLNSFWVAGEGVDMYDFDFLNYTAYKRYKDKPKYNRAERQTAEKLEQDLCLYRLLHKGFGRFVRKHGVDFVMDKKNLLNEPIIDGDCPFYDEEYRRVATTLYAKYAWI